MALVDDLLAARDDPLATLVLAADGEPDLDLAHTLLPPLVGPTFVGDRAVPVKPVVQPDATVAGVIVEPLEIAPGDLRCVQDTFTACVDARGTDRSGREVRRLIFATVENEQTALWWCDHAGEPVCRRSCGGHVEAVTPEAFDTALQAVAMRQAADLESAATFAVPVPFRNAARLSLLRALAAFVGRHPKYGWGGYEDAIHDTFPPVILSVGHALCDVGLPKLALELVSHWCERFVKDDGSLDYYGPSLSELGMLLDLAERLTATAREPIAAEALLDPCRRIGRRLLRLRDEYCGLLPGLAEADYAGDPESERTVYYSNNLWCVRGLHALARWLGADGESYLLAADLWLDEIRLLLRADSVYLPDGSPFLPAVAGGHAFPDRMTADRDASYANYRFYPEMLSSRLLTGRQAGVLFALRERHGGELCGTTRFLDWLDDWPAAEMGLAHLDYDRVHAARRLLVGHLAYHHAAGHETVYEQCSILPDESGHRTPKAGFCVPAQLVTPRLLRNLLVHETPGALWLNRAGFRRWLYEGYGVEGVTTRWGTVGFHIQADGDGIVARVNLSDLDPSVDVRIRLARPDGQPLTRLEIDGRTCDVLTDTLALPRPGERVEIRAA